MSTPLQISQAAISEDGFFKADDTEIGDGVQKMDEEGVQLASRRGFRFCSTNVLHNPQIRPIIESSFERSGWGVYRTFGPAPSIYSFLSSEQPENIEILIVMLWSKDSQVFFWPGSHRHWLEPAAAANSLLEIPEARLRHLNLQPKEQSLDQGGFTIHDARIAFHIRKGIALVFAFGTKQKVETWHPMMVPIGLKDIVDEIESTSIQINVAYLKEPAD